MYHNVKLKKIVNLTVVAVEKRHDLQLEHMHLFPQEVAKQHRLQHTHSTRQVHKEPTTINAQQIKHKLSCNIQIRQSGLGFLHIF